MLKEQAIKIVEDHIHEKVADINQVTNRGQVNEIYILATSQGKYVLRVDPNEDNLARFTKETWAMQVAQEQGVFIPEVFETGLVDGHPYTLMSFVEGVNGDEVDDQDSIWKRLGEYARKIHAIPVQGYGETMISPGVFSDSWLRFVDYNIFSLTADDKAIELGIITEEQSAELKKVFLELRDVQLTFGLMHYDLSLKNTIITPNGDVCLIDWGSVGASVVPHLDIAEILDSSLSEDSKQFNLFLEGYGMVRSDYEKLKSQIAHINLLIHMDKLRWAFDRRPDKIAYFSEKVKERLATL